MQQSVQTTYTNAMKRYRLDETIQTQIAEDEIVSHIPKNQYKKMEAFQIGSEFAIVMAILHRIEKAQEFATLLEYQENGIPHYAIYYLPDGYFGKKECVADPRSALKDDASSFSQIPLEEFVKGKGKCTIYLHPSMVHDRFKNYCNYIYKVVD